MKYKNIKLLMIPIVGILLSGCSSTYNNATASYAKNNNMSEKLYDKVSIQCITKQKINNMNDKKKIKNEFDNLTRAFFAKNCDTQFRQLYLFKGEDARPFYNKCINNAKTAKTFLKKDTIDEVAIYNVIMGNHLAGAKIGYFGIDTKKDNNILFYRPVQSAHDLLKQGIWQYINKNNIQCQKW